MEVRINSFASMQFQNRNGTLLCQIRNLRHTSTSTEPFSCHLRSPKLLHLSLELNGTGFPRAHCAPISWVYSSKYNDNLLRKSIETMFRVRDNLNIFHSTFKGVVTERNPRHDEFGKLGRVCDDCPTRPVDDLKISPCTRLPEFHHQATQRNAIILDTNYQEQ